MSSTPRTTTQSVRTPGAQEEEEDDEHDSHSPRLHAHLNKRRRFGPFIDNNRARPFGYYPVASHLAGDLAQRDGKSRKGSSEKKSSARELVPLTEQEKQVGVAKISVGSNAKSIEDIKKESSTLEGWALIRPKTENVLQPRYGPKFKDFVVTSDRNRVHRELAGHKRDRLEEDELYRSSNALRYDHEHDLFVDCNLAYEELPVVDVGIQWEAYILRSRLMGSSNIMQLRVKVLDPKGLAYSSGHVRVNDRLISIDG